MATSFFLHFDRFCLSESKRPSAAKESQDAQDDVTALKSLADGQKSETTEVPLKEEQYVPDESDSTKSRRLVEDYDSTKNRMDYGKYRGTHIIGCGVMKAAHHSFEVFLPDLCPHRLCPMATDWMKPRK